MDFPYGHSREEEQEEEEYPPRAPNHPQPYWPPPSHHSDEQRYPVETHQHYRPPSPPPHHHYNTDPEYPPPPQPTHHHYNTEPEYPPPPQPTHRFESQPDYPRVQHVSHEIHNQGFQPNPSEFRHESHRLESQSDYPHVQHVSHEINNQGFGPDPSEIRPETHHHDQHHQHQHSHNISSFFHHHSHEGGSEVSNKPSFRVYTKAEMGYSLTIRDGQVILAQSDPNDEFQHWIKDEKYSTKVKDEEGFPCFSLVNKATGQAMKHSIRATEPVQLIPYNSNVLDQSILWTESRDLGDGFRTIRMVNNIKLNLDAFNGDENHGGVHDGTTIVLWEWKKGANQRWKITLY